MLEWPEALSSRCRVLAGLKVKSAVRLEHEVRFLWMEEAGKVLLGRAVGV